MKHVLLTIFLSLSLVTSARHYQVVVAQAVYVLPCRARV